PSAISGTVGWMNAIDVISHMHILIDNDEKHFIITGTEAGYNRPWCCKKNLVITDLHAYKVDEFTVKVTEKVVANLRYYGSLNGVYISIHANLLKIINLK